MLGAIIAMPRNRVRNAAGERSRSATTNADCTRASDRHCAGEPGVGNRCATVDQSMLRAFASNAMGAASAWRCLDPHADSSPFPPRRNLQPGSQAGSGDDCGGLRDVSGTLRNCLADCCRLICSTVELVHVERRACCSIRRVKPPRRPQNREANPHSAKKSSLAAVPLCSPKGREWNGTPQ
jgi:hypothetical protein